MVDLAKIFTMTLWLGKYTKVYQNVSYKGLKMKKLKYTVYRKYIYAQSCNRLVKVFFTAITRWFQ